MSDVTVQPLGATVRASREARGWSLRGLARELGLSPATVSAIERDQVPVTRERARAIASALGTTVESLLRGEALTMAPLNPPDPDDWRRYDDLDLGPVLEAASRVFVRFGYHAATVRQIALEAQLSPAGVYHHYASKQEMIVALLDLTMAEIRWRVLAARDEGASAVESFSLMVESLALFHAVRDDLAFLGATEMRALKEPDHSRIVGLRNEVQHLLDEQVDVCVEAGEFQVANPRVAARAVATMCTSLPSWFRSGGELSAPSVARDYADYAIVMMR